MGEAEWKIMNLRLQNIYRLHSCVLSCALNSHNTCTPTCNEFRYNFICRHCNSYHLHSAPPCTRWGPLPSLILRRGLGAGGSINDVWSDGPSTCRWLTNVNAGSLATHKLTDTVRQLKITKLICLNPLLVNDSAVCAARTTPYWGRTGKAPRIYWSQH
jgi:hypothetical protein